MTETLSERYLLESTLVHTHKKLRDVCEQLGIDEPPELELEQCSSCGYWAKTLPRDLDDYPICSVCIDMYGL